MPRLAMPLGCPPDFEIERCEVLVMGHLRIFEEDEIPDALVLCGSAKREAETRSNIVPTQRSSLRPGVEILSTKRFHVRSEQEKIDEQQV
ncbi:hypothetical protein [Rhizobium oryzicola]|uniref:Uncharacterized protein n=1 Tax=Rhizobium oryzicola TaxID=1232668 RepID=A0ABT8SWQ0_9HYPH|nr:hypothetical protein [Rhizobium oryzicola]MDO1582885.1 hypothetical protein [Rhizobium oryzicola]